MLKDGIISELASTHPYEEHKITLADIALSECSLRMYSELVLQDGDPMPYQRNLTRRLREGLIDQIRKYCEETFHGFTPIAKADICIYDKPSDDTESLVEINILGKLSPPPPRQDEVFIDALPLPDALWTSIKETEEFPEWLSRLMAAKAHFFKSRIYLILLNRSNQEWVGFMVDALEEDKSGVSFINYVTSFGADFVNGSLTAYAGECSTCRFSKTCPEEKRTWKKTQFPEPQIKIKRDGLFLESINEMLFEKNKLETGRGGAIHPSEFSTTKCDRRTAYQLLSADRYPRIDSKLRIIFDTGHLVHDILQKVLGDHFKDEAIIELPVRHEETSIRGSCDIFLPEYRMAGEIKSMSDKSFNNSRSAKSQHIKQATCYAAPNKAKNLCFLYYNKESGFINEYIVPLNRDTWHSLSAKAISIKNEIAKGVLPEKNEGYECVECPYNKVCRDGVTIDQIIPF